MKDPINLPLALMNASATALAGGDQQYCGRVQQVTLSMELVKNVYLLIFKPESLADFTQCS